ncbi:MAG: hypothetical protein ABL989_05110 [Gammaproteobacteria bacterium]
MHKPRHSALLLALFCSLAGLAPEAHAYLDPSTGSMILSAIVGLFATIGLAVKTYWYKLKNLVLRRPPQKPGGPSAGPSAAQSPGQSPGQSNRSS